MEDAEGELDDYDDEEIEEEEDEEDEDLELGDDFAGPEEEKKDDMKDMDEADIKNEKEGKEIKQDVLNGEFIINMGNKLDIADANIHVLRNKQNIIQIDKESSRSIKCNRTFVSKFPILT